MMLELHNVAIGQRINHLSLTVSSGQIVPVTGSRGAGKTTLLRAVLGFIPVDEGHISIDGELLTPLSAPYFRRQMAYVPQQLLLPDDYDDMGLGQWNSLTEDERYVLLLTNAVRTEKPLLIVDEPAADISRETMATVDRLLGEAAGRGCTVLAVNSRILQNQVVL